MKRVNNILICCAVMTALLQTPAVAATADSGGVGAYVEKGDRAFRAHNNPEALRWYAEAATLAPEHYEALWKLSRAYVDIGDTCTDKSTRHDYFSKGYACSDSAVAVNPQGAKGYLYRGIAVGRIALDTTAKEKVRLSKELKSNLDKALALDPEDDYTLHGLARWHRAVATLNWVERSFAGMFLGGIPKDASVEKAAEYLQKAIAVNPGHVNHHLELGITREMLGKKDEAAAAYTRALSLPNKMAADDRYKKEAKERLDKLTQ